MSALRENRRSVSRWTMAVVVLAAVGAMSWWTQRDVAATPAGDGALAETEVEVVFDLPVPSSGMLRVRNTNGNIHVTSWDGREVRVEAVKRATVYPLADGGFFKPVQASVDGFAVANQAIANVDVVIREAEGWLVVQSEHTAVCEDSYVSVDYEIMVPESVAVAVRTDQGDIVVEGHMARIAAETLGGQIALYDVCNDASARTSSGAITIHCSRDTIPAGRISCQTLDGAITIGIPEPCPFGLELESVRGRFETEFPMMMSAGNDASRIRGQVGHGGPQFFIDTLDGAVSITALEEVQ